MFQFQIVLGWQNGKYEMLFLSEGQIEQDLDNYSENIEFEHKRAYIQRYIYVQYFSYSLEGGGESESAHLLA